jgi:hypothetical protein
MIYSTQGKAGIFPVVAGKSAATNSFPQLSRWRKLFGNKTLIDSGMNQE